MESKSNKNTNEVVENDLKGIAKKYFNKFMQLLVVFCLLLSFFGMLYEYCYFKILNVDVFNYFDFLNFFSVHDKKSF